jgi:hypothetical protein
MVDQPKTPEDVKQYLSIYCHITGSYTINDDLTVSVEGLVDQKLKSKQIPIKFRRLTRFRSRWKELRNLSCLPDEPFEHINIGYYKDLALLRCLNAKVIGLQASSWADQSMWDRYRSATQIMAKYQGQGQTGAMACAAELAAAGLKGNARW